MIRIYSKVFMLIIFVLFKIALGYAIAADIASANTHEIYWHLNQSELRKAVGAGGPIHPDLSAKVASASLGISDLRPTAIEGPFPRFNDANGKFYFVISYSEPVVLNTAVAHGIQLDGTAVGTCRVSAVQGGGNAKASTSSSVLQVLSGVQQVIVFVSNCNKAGTVSVASLPEGYVKNLKNQVSPAVNFFAAPVAFTIFNFAPANSIYVSVTAGATGKGTKSEPYNLATAVNNAKPGDKIILMPGVYTQPLALWGKMGTSASPIIISGQYPRSAIIDGSILPPINGQPRNAVFIGGGSKNIILTNLVIKNSPAFGVAVMGDNSSGSVDNITVAGVEIYQSQKNGLWANTTNHVSFVDNYVHDNVLENQNQKANNGQTAYWDQGIALAHTSNSLVEGNRVENNWGEGIDVIGSNATNNIVRANIVKDNYSVSVYLDSARYTSVDRNYIASGNQGFYRLDYSSHLSYPAEGVVVADERVFPNIGGSTDGLANAFNEVTRNLVVGARNGFRYGGYFNSDQSVLNVKHSFGLQNATIAKNTIYAPVESAFKFSAPNGVGAVESGGDMVTNNVSVVNSNVPLIIAPDSIGISFQGNVWWNASNATQVDTAGIIQASAVVVDPVFLKQCASAYPWECFRLKKSSPLVSAGVTGVGVFDRAASN